MFERILGKRQGKKGGLGLGQGDKPGSGPQVFCVCPACGHKVAHQVNKKCKDQKCPQCGSAMTRE